MRYAYDCERALDWLLNVGEEAAAAAAGITCGSTSTTAPHCPSVFDFFAFCSGVRSVIHNATAAFGATSTGAAAAASDRDDESLWMARLQVQLPIFQLQQNVFVGAQG
jgi:hypothetical protein